MSYTLPNRASIHSTPILQTHLATLEVDGIAIVGTSNGHIYHFRVFIYNRALSCSVSLDCNPTYETQDPDKACVTIDYKTYAWTQSQNAPSGQIPPSTGAFDAKLKAPSKVWNIFNVLFNSLKRDQYQWVVYMSVSFIIDRNADSMAVWDAGTGVVSSSAIWRCMAMLRTVPQRSLRNGNNPRAGNLVLPLSSTLASKEFSINDSSLR